MEQYDYHCSKCNQRLNVTGDVILYFERGNGQAGVIELKPTPGEYGYVTEPLIEFDKGESINLFCPACKSNIRSERFPNYAKLNMVISKGVEFEVLFSRVVGERKTYVITEDMIEKYGDDPEDLL